MRAPRIRSATPATPRRYRDVYDHYDGLVIGFGPSHKPSSRSALRLAKVGFHRGQRRRLVIKSISLSSAQGGCPPDPASVPTHGQSWTCRNRSEFVITETELKLIAAAATMGLSRRPKTGYSTPAAIGTPSEL